MQSKDASTRLTPGLFLLIVAGVLSLALAAYLLSRETVTIYDGSSAHSVNGRFATVNDALQAANLTLRPEDLVQPAPAAPPAAVIQIQRALQVNVTQDGRVQTFWTRQPTIGAFLAEARVPIDQSLELLVGDRALDLSTLDQTPLAQQISIRPRLLPVNPQVSDQQQNQPAGTSAPPEEQGIAPAATASAPVKVMIPFTVVADGVSTAVKSPFPDPAAILAAAGLTLGELDYTVPDVPLAAGDTLRVVRVREELLTQDEVLPYQTLYQPTPDLDLDTKAQLSPGTPGLRQRITRVRYEDGQEVSRVDEGEIVAQEPINEVIGYGTHINTGVIDTPEGPREYWRVVRMRATAYTAASSGKAPDHPAYGITASGLPAGTGIVAVDPNVVPFRSEVFVPGYGVGFAGDTGGGVKGRWIDLGYDEDELQTWNGYADVYYLTPVPAEINYLLPEVLP